MSEFNDFKKVIWSYYGNQGRLFDWRHADDPYKIFISEIMLQQTQTFRVAQKYPLFLAKFPNFNALASASLKDVLSAWQGLGYNRRGMYLHKAAQIIAKDHGQQLPNDPAILVTLPGIGPATAASMVAFAYNKPTIFIETNIRAVYLHFFFNGIEKVHDKELIPLIEVTVDKQNPKEWYYALMDYGVMLKKTIVNPSRKSKHHQQQSKFEGSDRQIRGKILKILTSISGAISLEKLTSMIDSDHARLNKIIQDLEKEEFIYITGNGGTEEILLR